MKSASAKLDAAISFAGEQRPLARSIVRQLSPLGYNIYYDAYNRNETVGKDLADYFHKVYGKTKVILIVVSKEYKKKPWTNLERRYAVENFIHNKGTLFQIKVDNTSLPGIPAQIQHYRYDNDIHDLCSAIASILGKKKAPALNAENSVVIEIMQTCFRRAIFTSMDEEINSKAMFKSITNCIRDLNRILPKIKDAELSQYVKGINELLNEIDRYSQKKENYTVLFKPEDKLKIDSLKLNLIDKIHYLNVHYQTLMDIPDDIGFNYDFRQYSFTDDGGKNI